MINRREINIESLTEVAEALDDLNERSVYVGGAVLSLYVNDPSAEDPRPTKDIDVAMEIATLGELENLRQKLAEKGFHNDPREKVMCRFSYKNILVDVMSTQEVRKYLKAELEKLSSLEEAVLGHLNPLTQNERYEILIEKIKLIIQSRP